MRLLLDERQFDQRGEGLLGQCDVGCARRSTRYPAARLHAACTIAKISVVDSHCQARGFA
jgi:hypothetical protein